jgi:branched-subunit amino acid ABC-type transport system permease component
LEETGLTGPVLERYEALLENPYGVLLVTGPTGSGKTTTLHTIATAAAQAGATVIAIDPIGALLVLAPDAPRLIPGDNLLLNPSDLSTDAWLALFGLPLTTDASLYLLALAVTILMVSIARNIVYSRLGRAFIAIRDHEAAAQALGIGLPRYKAYAFFISAFYTGIAGGLYAYIVGYISPGEFDLGKSIYIFSMMALGGMASIPGSLVGAFFLTFLPHWLSGFRGLQQFIYGAALVLVVIFMPYGIWGFVRRWTMPDRLKRLPRPLRVVVEFVRG